MKTIIASLVLFSSFGSTWAATTINAANKYGYGSNIGLMDWRGGGFLLEIRRWV